MAIQCPYCQYGISVRGLKPGRFSPKCPKCQKPFRLIVAPDEKNTITVEPLAGGDTTTGPSPTMAPQSAAPAVDATMAAPSRAPAAAPVEATLAKPAASAQPVEATMAAPSRAPASAAAASDVNVTRPATRPPTGGKSAAPAPSPDVTAPPLRPASRAPSAPRDGTAPSVAKPRTAAGPDATAPSRGGAAPAPAPGPAQEQADGDILTGTLGGYELVKRLGQGGMGSVYLARQMSLDRNVAVKTMNIEWAHDPTFVARFTREAYAAAQLNHHNVVQIYDIGAEQDTNYFSMEFVEGKTLGDVMRDKGKIDVEEAVGYILQAARGLKFAHDQGMVHRDIKPDNLMINKHGIVKVADLGLVKTPASVAAEEEAAKAPQGTASGTPAAAAPAKSKTGLAGLLAKSAASSNTRLDVAMGTPAYMAPEQGRNAAGVDGRADIYSLGCTLYVLITGRPVFEGTTAVEVMSKHASEPIVPPDMIVERVPKTLSAIIQKMVAKLPQDRYQSMDEVIQALEGFLGISTTGPFTPREEHARLLEQSVKDFNASKPAKMRKQIIWAFYAVCGLATLGLLLTRSLTGAMWAGGFIGLALVATVCYLAIVGFLQKTALFAKARQWAFGADWKDWAKTAVAVILAAFLLYEFIPLWLWLCVFIIAGAASAGLAFIVDRKVKADRQRSVDTVEEMLKSMRLKGLEEQALRMFVCKYSGNHWEEFYEAIFDYEGKMKARELWGKADSGRPRKKYAAWRDTIINTMEARIQQRKEAREKRYLAKIQAQELKAKGMTEAEAKKKAAESAETMVEKAAEFREAAAHYADQATMAPGSVRAPRPTFTAGSMLATDDDAARVRDRQRRVAGSRGRARLNMLFGPLPRFVVGALLLAACGMWLKSNNLFGEGGEATAVARTHDIKALADLGQRLLQPAPENGFTALSLPLVPDLIRAKLFNSIAPGVAGLILLLSSFLGRLKMAIFVVPGAAIAWLGTLAPLPADHPLIPAVPALNLMVLSIAAGVVLFVLGFLVARK